MPQLHRLDPAREAEGVWLTYQPGIKMLVASTAAPAYREAVRKLLRPTGGEMRAEVSVAEVVDNELALREMAGKHLLRGWRGIEDEHGAEVPYSVEQSVVYMTDPAYRPVYEFVYREATKEENYRAALMEEARGN